MSYEFVYADFRVVVTLAAEKDSAYDDLSDNESMALQQCIYLALSCYSQGRCLSIMSEIESDKGKGESGVLRFENPQGG